MRNRQVGPDHAADILADVVKRVSYKPGWTFALREISRGQGCEGLTLMIAAEVPDSWNPSERIGFLHLMPVPPAAFDEETWTRWVLDCILQVEQHEALEFFRLDGEPVYFPEHAPGRNPYTIAQIKTREQALSPAVPWTGGPATSEHFA